MEPTTGRPIDKICILCYKHIITNETFIALKCADNFFLWLLSIQLQQFQYPNSNKNICVWLFFANCASQSLTAGVVENLDTLKMSKSHKKLARVYAYTHAYTQIRDGGGKSAPPPSRIGLKRLHKKMHSHIAYICLIFLHCVFSYEPSNCLHESMHNRIDCICLILMCI